MCIVGVPFGAAASSLPFGACCGASAVVATLFTAALFAAVLFAAVLATVVVTFLMLMRAGYRWARTVLVAGALASIVYTVNALLTVPRNTTGALVYAGTGIVGVVLLAGGVFLLHRKDADAWFTR